MSDSKQSKHKESSLFLDFKKAFDSIKWEYLHKVLDAFNFKQDFKRWVKVFYTDSPHVR